MKGCGGQEKPSTGGAAGSKFTIDFRIIILRFNIYVLGTVDVVCL